LKNSDWKFEKLREINLRGNSTLLLDLGEILFWLLQTEIESLNISNIISFARAEEQPEFEKSIASLQAK
jgi:hypothetical protein